MLCGDRCITTGSPCFPARATVVPCVGITPAVTITAPSFAFLPATTNVSPGQIVVFDMPADHDAVSRDMLWDADFSMRTCVRFDVAGTYEYFCRPHGFTGVVVVR